MSAELAADTADIPRHAQQLRAAAASRKHDTAAVTSAKAHLARDKRARETHNERLAADIGPTELRARFGGGS